MEKYSCKNCGANDFERIDGQLVCKYCDTVYIPDVAQSKPKESTISLGSDVQVLFEKIKRDPNNAAMYANLILDIDPNNMLALSYLQ
ncbi:TFIIB-type zinc finger domain-containing protein [Lacticaseibacillus kribbianus]|uniref:TFIIB-type zinc finger domain-containing protein n=1 Tax=Lacticaseibacillus kribbianus TaxID=2926292 RepID=UPI001CD6D2EE|nr:TFIIB-type zinc finger domain-containing protein [Lacticaseibacillus kribbianus]